MSNIVSVNCVTVTRTGQSHGDVEVKLLCGADLLQSFSVPGIWKPEHVMYIYICQMLVYLW